MGWFSGKKSALETTVVEDPIKTAVSNPLSSYLASQIGKGLPRYEGTLNEPFDPKAYNTYQNFLSIDPESWYKNAIEKPTMMSVRESIPELEEGWAGGLRGSGRFRDVEEFSQNTFDKLAQNKYNAMLAIPQAQFGMAQSYKQMKDIDYSREYENWYKSLAQNNPAITQALQFLAGPTGRDVIAYQTAGESGKGAQIGSLLGLIAAGAISAMVPGAGAFGIPLMTMLAGGAGVGGMAGSLAN